MKTYRMYRGRMVGNGYGSGFHGGKAEDFTATARTFTARSQKEATRKMDRFLKQAQICGSFFVK